MHPAIYDHVSPFTSYHLLLNKAINLIYPSTGLASHLHFSLSAHVSLFIALFLVLPIYNLFRLEEQQKQH